MKIFSAPQIKEWDTITLQNQQISSWQLMERAALALADAIDNHQKLLHKKAYIFCGSGNNGGDGLALARYLYGRGRKVELIIATPEIPTSVDFELNFEKAQSMQIPVSVFTLNEFPDIDDSTSFVVDAIFGIGFREELSSSVADCITKLNQCTCPIISIDIPSGLYMDKHTDVAVQASWVLTFQTPKLPFFVPHNESFVSKFTVLPIELDSVYGLQTIGIGVYITQEFINTIYKPLNKFAHKGTQGHVCLIGGSYGKMGAMVLASKAALKSGCGLVTAYIPKSGVSILQTAIPEAMTLCDNQEQYISYINLPFVPSSIGIGMGLGILGETIQAFQEWLSHLNSPTVFDADAINIISKNQQLIRCLPKNSILTPHLKELQRLIGTWTDDFIMHEKVKSFAREYELIVVVKGPHSLITDGSEMYFNSTGNPAMATAGLGDTLTGVISSLLAQSYTPLEAAILGTFIHGKAADLALLDMGKESFTASDMSTYLGKVFKELNQLEF